MNKPLLIFLMILQGLLLSACSGVQTYPNKASAGDTVTLGLGWQKNFNRQNTTVHITPSVGPVITLDPGDPAIRALINFYPDPVSYMVVGTETNQSDGFNYGSTYGNMINLYYTDGDKDFWQTTAFIDLPETLPVGDTLIELTNNIGESITSNVMVVSGVGSSDDFIAELNGPLTPEQLASLERSPHFAVAFSGANLPYAIEVTISHSPDVIHGGTGKAYVVNPRGDIKNIFWSDTGTLLKVYITPARLSVLESFKDFKFYLAGGIDNPVIDNFKAYDSNGNEVVGVSAFID